MNMANLKAAQTLIQDIEGKIRKWNERSMFTLKGVKNLSRADMDMLEMYANQYIQNGGNFYGLMEPMGEIREVFEKYKMM